MVDSIQASESVVRVEPGSPVLTGIEWFTVAGATPPAGSSLSVDDMSTTLADPVAGATPAGHPDVGLAIAFIRDVLRQRRGFVGAVLLAGHRGELVVYSQWRQDSASTVSFPDEWSIAPALPGHPRFDARLYESDYTGPEPVTEISMSRTPHAHFGYFTVTPSDQPRMMDLAREHAPGSFKVPGLKAVNFHRSLDGKRVINLGLWSSFDQMLALLSRPGFKKGAEYWLEVAGFRPHYFTVAAVVD